MEEWTRDGAAGEGGWVVLDRSRLLGKDFNSIYKYLPEGRQHLHFKMK